MELQPEKTLGLTGVSFYIQYYVSTMLGLETYTLHIYMLSVCKGTGFSSILQYRNSGEKHNVTGKR